MRFLFLLLPWLELFTLIQLGIETSALTALAWVFASLFLGLALIQRQGRGIFEQLNSLQRGEAVGPNLFLDEMALGFAGVLLMVPGLITDSLALLVLIGPLRRRIGRFFGREPETGPATRREVDGSHTIEGSFRRVDDDK